jgi:hypothetical protein
MYSPGSRLSGVLDPVYKKCSFCVYSDTVKSDVETNGQSPQVYKFKTREQHLPTKDSD